MARPPANAPRRQTSKAPALTRWPNRPRAFSAAEALEWRRLGRAAMASGTLTAADLLVAEAYCRLAAKLAGLYADPGAKATTIGNLSRLVKEHLSAMGLTPSARKSVEAPAVVPMDTGLRRLL